MRSRRFLPLLTALAVATLTLAACGSGDGSAPAAAETEAETEGGPGAANTTTGSFPVSVEHAFGTTEITEEPERVVTWGWGSTEAAIAVGVHPVAVTEQVWTVGEGRHLPWVEDAIEAAGAEPPALLTDDFAAPPYEEIIAQEPDLILAPYSGIDEEQYTLLSEIAPTVAYPESAWSTPWREVIEITARALGRSEAGDEVLAEIDTYFDEQAAAHPEFDGVTVANIFDGDGFVSIYTSLDARVAMLTELGCEVADSVDELDTDAAPDNFYYELSYEQLDKLDADLLISYHSTQDEADAFLDKPETQAIPAVAERRVAQVVGNELISSVSPPTALSVEWGMPDLIERMSAALGD